MIPDQKIHYSVAILFCGGIFMNFVAAQDDTKNGPPSKFPPLAGFIEKNVAPTSIEELRAMEQHTQKVLERVMPAVVAVRVGLGTGSGVIIDLQGHVLTAGQILSNDQAFYRSDQAAVVTLPDGTQLRAKTLGRNRSMDSGLVIINQDDIKTKMKGGKLPFLDMGKSVELTKGQWVLCIGHPHGFHLNRTASVRLGRIIHANSFVIRTDCPLIGGDAGGPLLDMQGRVIGINSRIALDISENMHVPVDVYRKQWEKLARGDSLGGIGHMEIVRSAGGKLVFEKQDTLRKDNGSAMASPTHPNATSYFKAYTFRMKAGHTYTIDLISSDKPRPQLDTFLRLHDTDEKLIVENYDGGKSPNSRIVYKSLKDADYRIVATSFDPGQTGGFTLKIFDADFTDALVSGKVEVFKALKLPTPTVAKRANAFANENAPLHINVVLIDEKGNPLPNKELALQWDNGTVTLKTNTHGVVRWPLVTGKTRKLTVQLFKGTRALLALTDRDGEWSELKFHDGDPSIEKVKGAGGAIVRIFDGKLSDDPNDTKVHEFQMKAGRIYTLDLASEDFDAFLRIEDKAKSKLAEDNNGAGFLNSRIVFTPEEDGTYRMIVTAFDGQTGAYRLTIREKK